jgi:predicted nucleic acid-binding protein
MYAAVLDANVLAPFALSDTLLRVAADGFYRPLWSDQILTEVQYTIQRIRPELEPARVSRRIDAMNAAFIDARVEGWEEVAAGLDLPDHDDRHVLATAITGGAQAIVPLQHQGLPGRTPGAQRHRGAISGRVPARPARPFTERHA